MNTLLGAGLLVAQLDRSSRLSAMRGGLEEGASKDSNLTLMLYLLGAVLLVFLVYALFQKRPQRNMVRRTDYLAHGARLLGLNRSELRDLRTVASQARLTQPAAMLLSPANIAHALGAALAHQDDPQLRLRVDALSRKLFGQPSSKTPQPPTETAPSATHG